MIKWGIRTRDIVLTAVLLLLAGGIFLVVHFVALSGDKSYASVYYGNASEPIVTVNFDSGHVEVNYEQAVPSIYTTTYPVVENGQNTDGHSVIWVTLLGDYEIDDVRQELVVEFDLDQKSIQIIEEESPQNICSRQGVSTAAPLICLPNRVRVEFVTSGDVDIDYLS